MTHFQESQAPPAQDQAPFVRLVSGSLRTAVEQVVSEHRGRRWIVGGIRDMTEFACHPSAVLSDGSYSVFVKFSEAADGFEQFEIEVAGLRLLSERAGVLTPMPIDILRVPGGSILVLEAVEVVDRTPRHWRQVGRTLARIHAVVGDRFGLDRDGYIGPLFQDNRPASDWPTFYAERRLGPGLRMAIDSGHLPQDLIRPVEKLIARLPELCGPAPVPTLLHGDAQQNNFISAESGVVVIDPAVYYGHPEMDLAAVACYQDVPDDVFAGYREVGTINPGFWERRDLWRLWIYLAAVAVEGHYYLGRLIEALGTYG